MTPPGPGTKAVILAAGHGTRMKSRLPKVLHPLCGRPMLAYVIDAAREGTGVQPVVVYSPASAQLEGLFAADASFALQQEPRGTGDALGAALTALPDGVEQIVVLSGDVPLIEAELVALIAERRAASGAPMILAAFETDDPTGYGRVILARGKSPRNAKAVEQIVEEKDATDEQRSVTLVNAGLYAFELAWLKGAIKRLTASLATGELYLTQLVELAAADGRPAIAMLEDEPGEWAADLAGINDRADLAEAQLLLQYDIIQRHIEAGVTFHDPAATVVDASVELEADVTIEANVTLRGRTSIGGDSIIRAGSQLIDAQVGRECDVWASVIESSQVGDRVRIGPFAHLRAGCVVGDEAQIGNFAEQKNTRFGARSKQHHFSYLGDAEVGEDVNIGAGTITANYDGKRKSTTIIGNGAFIGSDTILRAPVTVGAGAYTGAGSVVTRDVPPGKLAVGIPARIRERRVTGAETDI